LEPNVTLEPRGLTGEGLALVGQIGGPVYHDAGGLYVYDHVGYKVLDHLEPADLLPEGHALIGVLNGPVQGLLGDAYRPGGDSDASVVQGVEDDLEARAFLVEAPGCGNPAIIEDEFRGGYTL